jgi:pyruvate dehydrogenase complex dehydrogenase (E1) component
VDAKHIAYRAIYALYQSEALDIGVVQDAHARYQIDSQKPYTLYT